MAESKNANSKLLVTIKTIFIVIIFICFVLMGTAFSLRMITSKDNMLKINDNYYDYVNYGDVMDLPFKDVAASSSENYFLDFSNGISGLLDSFGITPMIEAFKYFKSQKNIMFLMDDIVNLSDVLNASSIKSIATTAFKTSEINGYYYTGTKTFIHLKVELTYLYYDSLKDKDIEADWDNQISQTVTRVLKENTNDYKVLLRRETTMLDSDEIENFEKALANYLVTSMKTPTDAFSGLNKYVKIYLRDVFSDYLFGFCLGIVLFLFVMIVLIGESLKQAVHVMGGIFIFSFFTGLAGSLLIYILFYKDFPKVLEFNYQSFLPTIVLSLICLIVGVILLAIGRTKKAKRAKKVKSKNNTPKPEQDIIVPDTETLSVMSDLKMFDKMNTYGSKIIDYYGDGRALDLQKKWQENLKKDNKEKKEEAPIATDVSTSEKDEEEKQSLEAKENIEDQVKESAEKLTQNEEPNDSKESADASNLKEESLQTGDKELHN